MGTYDCLTNREIERLQALRDSGLSIRQISKKTGRSRETVSRRTTSVPLPAMDYAKRNRFLLECIDKMRREARESLESLATGHGFADYQSMTAQLTKYRRRLREAGQVFAEAAE